MQQDLATEAMGTQTVVAAQETESNVLVVRRLRSIVPECYAVKDEDGSQIGEIVWPWMAQPKNARVKWHADGSDAGDVKIKLGGRVHRVRFELEGAGYFRDVRFTLERDERVLAVVEAGPSFGGWSKRRMRVSLPFEGWIERRGSFLKVRYVVKEGGEEIGLIEERRWLAVTRELHVEVKPGLSKECRLFFAFLVCNAEFG